MIIKNVIITFNIVTSFLLLKDKNRWEKGILHYYIILALDGCTSRCWNPLQWNTVPLLHRLAVSILTVFNPFTAVANGRLTLPAAKCKVLLVFTSVTCSYVSVASNACFGASESSPTFRWHCNEAPKSVLLFHLVDTGHRCHISTGF